MKSPHFIIASLACAFGLFLRARAENLPHTESLTLSGDLAAQMVDGIDRFLSNDLVARVQNRAGFWRRDFSSMTNYLTSVETNRQHFREITGLIDHRDTIRLEVETPLLSASEPGLDRGRSFVAETGEYRVYSVSWNVFRGVRGEGLLLEPKRRAVANVVAAPDCDMSPEMLAGLASGLAPEAQFAPRLAENGCRVLIPTLVDRGDTYSGLPGVRHTRQSQREFLWRAAYEMGRTLAGYETQKILAAVDWFSQEAPHAPIGVIGYGEGGLLALYAGASDTRIDATAVCGYFQPREATYQEPIYRNVWSLLEQYGDAELAGLIAPRALVIEAGKYPTAEYPAPGQPHDGAAPGKLVPPDPVHVEQEVARAREWIRPIPATTRLTFVKAGPEAIANDETLRAFLVGLGVKQTPRFSLEAPRLVEAPTTRVAQAYAEILEDTQWLMRESEFTRAKFWGKADRKSAESFVASAQAYRDYFWDEIIGRLPRATLPPRPRSRLIIETPAFKGYEVTLDVFPDVFAYGILLVPVNIPAGERRPVVVCQHGLEGRPSDVADPKVDSQYYHAFACRLAEQGYVTFAPQNPYIGQNRFRQVLRKAQPLKRTLFSFIVRQHEVILDWLASLDYVDPQRMAFYGLSYGGKTAMRVPSLLDRYCLSICSADYNEWIWKNVAARSPYCYLFGGEYDMPEFNLGNTFNYSEMSWLILPRPFMVERGHGDGVAPDEWVAYEFAKTRRMYDQLGLGDRTTIEFFNGPHTINGKGTFAFLRQNLHWPQGP